MLFDKHENIKIPHLLHCPRPISGQSDSLCNWMGVLFMKTIPTFPRYSITIDGVITNKKGQELKPRLDKKGYWRLMIRDITGKARHQFIHRLIAITYIPNPMNRPCINHINGIKTDNSINNLEWCTQSENIKHAFKTGLKIPHSRLSMADAMKIRELKQQGTSVQKIKEIYGISGKHAYEIIQNKAWIVT